MVHDSGHPFICPGRLGVAASKGSLGVSGCHSGHEDGGSAVVAIAIDLLQPSVKESIVSSEPPNMPPLGETVQDRVLALTQGAIGAIPGVGSILAEIVSQFIPNQRAARVEEFLLLLEARVRALECPPSISQLTSAHAIDLIEEGGFQAARALTSDRIQKIVEVVMHGLVKADQDKIYDKRLLRILGELDDDQIIILSSYLRKNIGNEVFLNTHRNLLKSRVVSSMEPIEVIDDATMREAAFAGLERLGLTHQVFHNRKLYDPAKIDMHGKLQGGRTTISRLGVKLLQAIGIAAETEYY